MRSGESAALEPRRHHGWDHQETDPEAPLQVSERAAPVPSAGHRLRGTGRRFGLCRCCRRPRPASGVTRRAAGLGGPGSPPGAGADDVPGVTQVLGGWGGLGPGRAGGEAPRARSRAVPLTEEDWGVCACVCQGNVNLVIVLGGGPPTWRSRSAAREGVLFAQFGFVLGK